MTITGFLRLAGKHGDSPARRGASFAAMNLPPQALWIAFALVIVLNTLMFSVSMILMPGTDPSMATGSGAAPPCSEPCLPWRLRLIGAVTICGRPLGGHRDRGSRIAILVIWLQALRVLVQGVVLVLDRSAAFLSGVVISAATVLGLVDPREFY